MPRPWDIIDDIQANIGQIRSIKHARKGSEGYYGSGYRDALRGPARILFSLTGQPPDEIVDSLRRTGQWGEDASVDDLWDALDKANKVRREYARGDHPERQQERFGKAIRAQEKARCTRKVPVAELPTGSRFKIRREPFEVTDIDPDTLETQIRDGKRYGSQIIPDGALLPIDAPCPAKVRHSSHRAQPVPKKPRRPTKAARVMRARPGKRRRTLKGTTCAPSPPPARRKRRKRKVRITTHRRASSPRRHRRPAAHYIAIRKGTRFTLARVIGAKLRSLGTFSCKGIRAWAQRHGVRIR